MSITMPRESEVSFVRAELRTELETVKYEILKWMFTLWLGQFVMTAGLIFIFASK